MPGPCRLGHKPSYNSPMCVIASPPIQTISAADPNAVAPRPRLCLTAHSPLSKSATRFILLPLHHATPCLLPL
jgi:hypothetical protein